MNIYIYIYIRYIYIYICISNFKFVCKSLDCTFSAAFMSYAMYINMGPLEKHG